jgi:hypothetical protein
LSHVGEDLGGEIAVEDVVSFLPTWASLFCLPPWETASWWLPGDAEGGVGDVAAGVEIVVAVGEGEGGDAGEVAGEGRADDGEVVLADLVVNHLVLLTTGERRGGLGHERGLRAARAHRRRQLADLRFEEADALEVGVELDVLRGGHLALEPGEIAAHEIEDALLLRHLALDDAGSTVVPGPPTMAVPRMLAKFFMGRGSPNFGCDVPP